jgi:hypothetical protein
VYRLLLLFFRGNFKEFKTNLNYAINKRLNKYRVIKIFKSLSKKLISDQKDYRLIVYKNFDYNYSKFREIFKKYGSNKGGEWTQRNNIIRHFYADLYEDILANKDIKNLLEIGIGLGSEAPGSSLKSWKELYPNANIYGADINKKVLFEEDRIKTFYTNQLSEPDLINFKKRINQIKFEVIIDDGLHTYEANIKTFEILYDLLEKDGYYFIEDIIYPNLKKYINYFDNKYNFKVIEMLNVNEPWGNCMVIIRK